MFACQISRFPQSDRNETERFSVGGTRPVSRGSNPAQIPIDWPDRPATIPRPCGLQIPDDVTRSGRSHAGKHYAPARARTAFHADPA